MKIFKLSLFVLLPILIFTIFYILVAFVDFEFNPADMKVGVRYILSFLGIVSIAGGLFAAKIINDENP